MEEMIRRFVVRSQETFYDEHLGEMNNVSHVIYHFQDFNLDFHNSRDECFTKHSDLIHYQKA